nr:hypothetical protein [Cryptosporangium phraense]
MYVENVVFDPPVSWLNTSSGRASASVTRTRSSGTDSSSAMSIADEVVMPCPTSARGSANETVPSALTTTEIKFDVGAAASVIRSLRSTISVRSAAAGPEPSRSAAATRVGAARTYPRKRRRPIVTRAIMASAEAVDGKNVDFSRLFRRL